MILKLAGQYQHYNWGGADFIPSWRKLTEKSPKPYAEYWLGAHRSASSLVEFEQKWLPLDRLLDAAPELLGEESRAKFGDELPFLLKILDVKHPLSIQIHPTKTQAEQGFAQETRQGIALNAHNRTYKDRNHKPEMMIALSDFWLLHGFKPLAQLLADLNRQPSLVPLAQRIHQHGLPTVYAEIMQAEQTQLAQWLQPIIEQNQTAYQQGKISPATAEYWLLYSIDVLNISPTQLDAGLLSFYLFNLVQLKKGQGIYQGAGLPHAYLRGQNIELMAASDNVIRGGLTPKYIDIPALLNTLDYQEIVPEIIPPAPCELKSNTTQADTPLYLYPTSQAEDFALQRLDFAELDQVELTSSSATILLVMSGSMTLTFDNHSLLLTQGESAFISAGSQFLAIGEQKGYAVMATLP